MPKTARPRSHRLRGCVLVVVSGIAWGFSGTCIQYLTSTAGVAVNWVNFWRMAVSAVLLLLLCLCSSSRRTQLCQIVRRPRSLAHLAAYAIFGVYACQHCYMESISYTNAGVATMMEQVGLVVVVAWECLRQREAPSWREAVGVLLALAGMFCICTQGSLQFALSDDALLWGTLSIFAMACYIMLPVGLTRQWDSIVITAAAMTLAAALAAVTLQPWAFAPAQLTLPIIAAMAGAVLLGTLVSYLMFLEGIKHAGPVLASLLEAVEPIAATAFSALLLGTFITGWDWLGCGLIIAMIALVSLK